MDTNNPYFASAEVAYRRQQARQGFPRNRRKRNQRNQRNETRPIGKPLTDDGL